MPAPAAYGFARHLHEKSTAIALQFDLKVLSPHIAVLNKHNAGVEPGFTLLDAWVNQLGQRGLALQIPKKWLLATMVLRVSVCFARSWN